MDDECGSSAVAITAGWLDGWILATIKGEREGAFRFSKLLVIILFVKFCCFLFEAKIFIPFLPFENFQDI